MAMFKMNPMYAGDAELCVVAGSYVFTNASAPTANTVVQSALFQATPAANNSSIGQNETVAPQGSKVPCVAYPTTGYAPAVAAGAGTNVAMLDLRAYPGDIVCVQVQLVAPASATSGTLNLTPLEASVIGIDQVNKFVYVQAYTTAGAAQAFSGGVALHFVAFFKDGFAP